MAINYFNINNVLNGLSKQLRYNNCMRKQASIVDTFRKLWNDEPVNLSGAPISEAQQAAYQKNKEEREKYAPYAPKQRAIYIPRNGFMGGMHLPGVNLYVNYPEGSVPNYLYKDTMDHEHGHDATNFMGLPLAQPYVDTLLGIEDDANVDARRNDPTRQQAANILGIDNSKNQMDRRGGITRYSMEEPSTMQELASDVLDTDNFNGLRASYNIFNRQPYMHYLSAQDTGPFGPGELSNDKFIDYTMPKDPNYKPSGWERFKRYAKWGLGGALAGAALGAGGGGLGLAKDKLRGGKKGYTGRHVLARAGIGALGGALGGLILGHMFKREPMVSPDLSKRPVSSTPRMSPLINSLDVPDDVKQDMLRMAGKNITGDDQLATNMDPRLAKLENWVNSAVGDPGEYSKRYSLATLARRGMNIVKDKNGNLVPTPQGVVQGISQQRDPATKEQYAQLKNQVLSRLAMYKDNPRYLNVMKKWHLSPKGDGLTGINKFSLTIEQMNDILNDFDNEDRLQRLDNSPGVNGSGYYAQYNGMA